MLYSAFFTSKYFRIVFAGVALASILFWFKGVLDERKELQIEITNIQEQLGQLQKQTKALDSGRKVSEKVLEELRPAQEQIKEIKEEVQNVPIEEDAPLAPVLRDTLARLRLVAKEHEDRTCGSRASC